MLLTILNLAPLVLLALCWPSLHICSFICELLMLPLSFDYFSATCQKALVGSRYGTIRMSKPGWPVKGVKAES